MKYYLIVLALSIQVLLGSASNQDVEKRIDQVIKIFEDEPNIYVLPEAVKVILDDLLINASLLVSDRTAIKQLAPKFRKLAVYLARCCTIQFVELREDLLETVTRKLNNTMLGATVKSVLAPASERVVRGINYLQEELPQMFFSSFWTDFSMRNVLGAITGSGNEALIDVVNTLLVKLYGYRWLQDLSIVLTGKIVCWIRKIFNDANIEIHQCDAV